MRQLLLIGLLTTTLPAEVNPDRTIAREFVEAHNAVRARLSLPPLSWSPELARYAAPWAARLAAAGRLYHRPRSIYGENLYLIGNGHSDPAEVVSGWASEAANYDYRTNRCRGRCGHYTQMIWRDTKRVGCAGARSGAVEVWVCDYDPPGNYVGERPY